MEHFGSCSDFFPAMSAVIDEEPMTSNICSPCLNLVAPMPEHFCPEPNTIPAGSASLAAAASDRVWKQSLKTNVSKLTLSLSSPSPAGLKRKAAPIEPINHPKAPPLQLADTAQPPQPPQGGGLNILGTLADTSNADMPGDTGGTTDIQIKRRKTAGAHNPVTKRLTNAFDFIKRRQLCKAPTLLQHYKDLCAAHKNGRPIIKDF